MFKTAQEWEYLIHISRLTMRELEELTERVGALAQRRAVNPFWAKHLVRALIRDIEVLRFWLWPIEHDYTERTENAWKKLSDALDGAEFALQKGRIYLQEEIEENIP